MQGADYLEFDLVMSKDAQLMVFHDLTLEKTTDVAERYPSRQREDGHWYVMDFNADELRTLEARERFDNRYSGRSAGFSIPSFEDVLELTHELNELSRCNVGGYPELKSPAIHYENGLPMESTLMPALEEYGYQDENDPVYVQSFDQDSLQTLRYRLGSSLKLVQLMGSGENYDYMSSRSGLEDVADYANGIGVAKSRLAQSGGDIVDHAQSLDLVVHPYTYRADQLPDGYSDFQHEVTDAIKKFGVDGVSTDHTDQVMSTLERNEELSVPIAERCTG